MAKQKIESLKELIYWSYSNLAMTHSAIDKNQAKYGMINYMIRARLFKALKEGRMNMRTIFDDEKIKIHTGTICNYCGSINNLALDHIFSKRNGGQDNAENLILVCRSCNSSKGKKDLMEWMTITNRTLPLMIKRRYLKLLFNYCSAHDLLDCSIEDIKKQETSF